MEKYELIKKIGEGYFLSFIFFTNIDWYFRTYGIVSIAWHIETGMFVAIKKFKESDDNEYVSTAVACDIQKINLKSKVIMMCAIKLGL